MADDELTHFRFDFGGIKLEVSGDREFVREMYHRVMQDVEKARRGSVDETNGVQITKKEGTTEKLAPAREASVWAHRCSDLMRKIYMLSSQGIKGTPLANFVDISAVKNVYIAKDIFDEILPGTESSQTLWAEFTQAGRKKIAEVTHPMSKSALQAPKSQS